MANLPTNRDFQRTDFVDSLYQELKKQTASALQDQKRYFNMAKEYLADGLDDSECIELLVIDGLARNAASNYLNMVKSESEDCDRMPEYSFQFEDTYGKRYSSYDIGLTVRATSDAEATHEAERLLSDEADEFDFDKIVSVTRIS